MWILFRFWLDNHSAFNPGGKFSIFTQEKVDDCLWQLFQTLNYFIIIDTKARFKRWTLHVPNLLQMSENNRFFSLALDSTHGKFDVWNGSNFNISMMCLTFGVYSFQVTLGQFDNYRNGKRFWSMLYSLRCIWFLYEGLAFRRNIHYKYNDFGRESPRSASIG